MLMQLFHVTVIVCDWQLGRSQRLLLFTWTHLQPSSLSLSLSLCLSLSFSFIIWSPSSVCKLFRSYLFLSLLLFSLLHFCLSHILFLLVFTSYLLYWMFLSTVWLLSVTFSFSSLSLSYPVSIFFIKENEFDIRSNFLICFVKLISTWRASKRIDTWNISKKVFDV